MKTNTTISRIGNRIQRCVPKAAAVALSSSLAATNAEAGAPSSDDYVEPSTPFHFRVERFEHNPIITRELPGLGEELGNNINGPSLIRVPDWVENPMGKYYLYFSHHHGKYIRLAYADALEGPWTIHEPGVLPLEETPSYHERRGDHVASPDVLIDEENQRIVMYYHGHRIPGHPMNHQVTYVAVSDNGLDFESLPDPLGHFYFRVFRHDDGYHYALAKYRNAGGVMYRSRDGLRDFEEGPRILPRVRHMALWQHEGNLYVFFSRGGDAPEHIMVSRIENLGDDWHDWQFTTPQTVLKPEKQWEGANEPIERSRWGAMYQPVHQLRDPAIYEEDGRVYMLYSTAGEQALAIAEIFLEEE